MNKKYVFHVNKYFTEPVITFMRFLFIGIVLPAPLFAESLILSCPHGNIPFKVELAQTPDEKAKGLMLRTQLAEDEGMLFLFPQPQMVTMWMKNTPLPLDMVFCTGEGKILAIHEKTIPYSLKKIGPVESTAQVLEVRGGMVQKHGITQACTLTLDR